MLKKIIVTGLLALMTSCAPNQSAPQVESPAPINATETPSPTVTPAPTFTSTPTSIPTSVPKYFTDEFDHDLGGWASFQTGGEQPAETALRNDSLILEMNSPYTWFYAIHNAHEYSEVFVSAKFSGEPAGAVGLVCHYTEANGWYEFNVTNEGTYNLLHGQWLTEGIAEYRPILKESSEYLKDGKLDYTIGLTCKENIVLLQINEKIFRKIDLAHIGLTHGKTGMTASSFNAAMNVNFEWFKISKPE